jgi:hypothetical protein
MTEIVSFGDLDIGNWDLFGIWNLEIGISYEGMKEDRR